MKNYSYIGLITLLLALIVYALWVHPRNNYDYKYGVSLGIDIAANEEFILVLSDKVGNNASVNSVKLHDENIDLELASIDLHDSIQFVRIENMLRYLKSTTIQFYDSSTSEYYNVKKREFDFSTEGKVIKYCGKDTYCLKIRVEKTIDSYELAFKTLNENDLKYLEEKLCHE